MNGHWYVAPTLDTLLAEVNTAAPARSKASDGSIGDPDHSARDSDHNPDDKGMVHARDFTHDPPGGFDSYGFAEWVRGQVNAGLMHIGYVISNGQIFNPDISELWRPYTGTNPHEHHVHVSIRYDHRETDTSPWGWEGPDMPLNQGDLDQIAALIHEQVLDIVRKEGISGAANGLGGGPNPTTPVADTIIAELRKVPAWINAPDG